MITRKSTNWDLLLNETIPPRTRANTCSAAVIEKVLLTSVDRCSCLYMSEWLSGTCSAVSTRNTTTTASNLVPGPSTEPIKKHEPQPWQQTTHEYIGPRFSDYPRWRSYQVSLLSTAKPVESPSAHTYISLYDARYIPSLLPSFFFSPYPFGIALTRASASPRSRLWHWRLLTSRCSFIPAYHTSM